MRGRALLLALPLLLSACAGSAAPFGAAAAPSLTTREKVEAQLRKESGGGTTDPAAAPAGRAPPGSVPRAPQQLPNTATADPATLDAHTAIAAGPGSDVAAGIQASIIR